MKSAYAVAALALVLGGNAGANDGQEGGSRTREVVEVSAYAGGSVVQSTFKDWSFYERSDDGSYISRSMDDSDVGTRVFGGLELGRYFAFEFGYANHGEATFMSQSDGSGSFWAPGPVAETIELRSTDVTLLGKLPLSESVALFGRVGTFRWKSKVKRSGASQSGGSFTLRDPTGGSETAYSAGLQYDGFRPVRVVVEYSAVSFGNASFYPLQPKLETIVLSLAYVFSRE